MRINVFVANATGMSRRTADKLIGQGRVSIDGSPARLGKTVEPTSTVTLDGNVITAGVKVTTVLLNKPVGYVCSRNGQGSRTIYDLLPQQYHRLKPVGRLDKDSSGLLLLTNDGQLANTLTHPRFAKEKLYTVELDRPLSTADHSQIEHGVQLEDGISSLRLKKLSNTATLWRVSIQEGRNRQIRRTFAALGYEVRSLHRTDFGEYHLDDIPSGSWKQLDSKN
jgi:23S rRNA pseudouridine2605 synthase